MQRGWQARTPQHRTPPGTVVAGELERRLPLNVASRSDPIEELEGGPIAAEEHVLPVVHELPRGPIGKRGGPAAKLRPRLEHEHGYAGLRERGGRAQAGEAGTHDHHIGTAGAHGRTIARAHTRAAMSARRGRGMRTTASNTS